MCFPPNEVSGQSITLFFKKEAVVLMLTIKENQGVTNKYHQPNHDVYVLINISPSILVQKSLEAFQLKEILLR